MLFISLQICPFCQEQLFVCNIFLTCLIDFTILSTYVDDTQIVYPGDNVKDVEQAINSDRGKIDKWYEENDIRRNHDKYKARGGEGVSKEICGTVRLPVWRHVSRQWLSKWRAKCSSKRRIKISILLKLDLSTFLELNVQWCNEF